MKNSILHQIYAGYEKNVKKNKIVCLKNIYNFGLDHFFIEVI